MSGLTPYERELAKRLKGFPLPDKLTAWEKMKQLLEEDSDKGVVVPPPEQNNNLWKLLILALIIIAGSMCLILFSSKKASVTQRPVNDLTNVVMSNPTEATAGKPEPGNTPVKNIAQPADNINKDGQLLNTNSNYNKTLTTKEGSIKNGVAKKQGIVHSANAIVKSNSDTLQSTLHETTSNNESGYKTRRNITGKKTIPSKITCTTTKRKINKNSNNDVATVAMNSKQASSTKKHFLVINKKGKIKINTTNGEVSSEEPGTPNTGITIILADSSKNTLAATKLQPLLSNDNVDKKDSVIKPLAETKGDSSILAKKKKNAKKDKPYFAIGVAAQQAIGLNCNCVYQKANYTNTNPFASYLPSVYARFYLAKKWFIQSEFKYAAPQSIRAFMYKSEIQNKPYDFVATVYLLNKVYYHEIPVSINYFVMPKWPIGLGVAYNMFSSAVSQTEVSKKPYGLRDSLVSSTIERDKNKPDFVSLANYFQAFIQTEYQSRRFSFGARYAAGLQPYVKYTDPFTHQPAERKNSSLNVFIRYQLWDSKK